MRSRPDRADAAKRLRELIRIMEAPEPQKETRLGAKAVRIRGKGSRAEKARAHIVHSVREANNNLSEIIASALAGESQIIKKGGGTAVIVISIETAKDLLALAERPRSLADMFPVDENNPPVSRLVITNRPGRTRVKY